LLPGHHWANNLTITDEDVERLSHILLEKETPLSSKELLRVLLEDRIQKESVALEKRFKDTVPYNPANSYKSGQKLVFPAMEFAVATIEDIREGTNPEYGEFDVATVTFEGESRTREFAINLQTEHKLIDQAENANSKFGVVTYSVDEILEAVGNKLVDEVDSHLHETGELLHVAGKWFPIDLMLEVNDGFLNLAEAVLDINGGGPMPTSQIIQEVGGLGNSPASLQEFSMNYALNEDPRFDEVGPAGEVLWYLVRMEPEDVQSTPPLLRHMPVEYDHSMLTDEMEALEIEIADELSGFAPHKNVTEGRATLIYPHRRLGTLPLNHNVAGVFPRIGTTSRIWFTIVDAADGEEYTGWLVPDGRYVSGFGGIYRKYALPIGAQITLRKTDDPGRIEVDVPAYKPRTEWVRLVTTNGEQLQFENTKRSIGAEFDDLMIIGIDDLEPIDEFVKNLPASRKNIASILKMIVPGLSRLTPQGTVHATTIYSVFNIIRRCPPGAILATLIANPDFENVGGHYWKLSEA